MTRLSSKSAREITNLPPKTNSLTSDVIDGIINAPDPIFLKPKSKNMITFTSPLRKAHVRLSAVISALLFLARISFAGVQIMVGHNAGELESPSFTFTNVPPPSRSDAATAAKFTIVSGEADANSGDLE